MKSLFGDNRIANMLYLLNNSQMMSVSVIAAKLHVSERTIRNDMKQLDKMLEGCAVIESVQGKYSLRIYDYDRFAKIYQEITQADEFLNSSQNRIDYMFGKLMRSDMPVLTDDLAYEMSVGRTTLIGDLKKLRGELEKYQIMIEGKTSKGLVLYGNESDIRKYVLEECFESIYKDYPMDEEILDIIHKGFQKNLLESKVEEEFRQYIILMIDRFLTGHYIGTLSARYYNLMATSEFRMVSELIDEIGDALKIEFPAEEKLFTLLPIIGMRTPAEIKEMKSIELDQKVRPLLKKVLEQIRLETTLVIDLADFEEEFLYHLMFMMNRLSFHVKLQNPMMEDLKEKYPLAYQLAGIASKVIEKEYNLIVTEDEQGYLATYFGVFLAESQLKMEKRFKIAVVCGTGMVTGRLVALQLKKIMDSSTDITQYAVDAATEDVLSEYDLVVSTVRLNCECDRPLIYTNEIFNEQELRRKIAKIRYWDQVEDHHLNDNWFVMASLLKENHFFILDHATSYENGLAHMVDSLIDDGLLDEDFLARLSEREKMGSMAFDNSIALPHSIQFATDKLTLAIGVFPKPMIYRETKISVIFLMGLPDNPDADDDLLIRIYDEIISVSQNQELLDKIVSADSYSNLMKILYRLSE
ncbi:MAG: PRD domain-containing protein [Dorea sp.]|nr:PRD domain-containing protein [Dorea sp.]